MEAAKVDGKLNPNANAETSVSISLCDREKSLEKLQDRCIQRYPGLHGSDDKIQVCMAELGNVGNFMTMRLILGSTSSATSASRGTRHSSILTLAN